MEGPRLGWVRGQGGEGFELARHGVHDIRARCSQPRERVQTQKREFIIAADWMEPAQVDTAGFLRLIGCELEVLGVAGSLLVGVTSTILWSVRVFF